MPISNILKKLNRRDTRILPSINTLTKIIFITIIAISATFFVKNILAATNILKQTQDAQNASNNAESWQLNSWNTNAVNGLTTLTGEIPFKDDGSVDVEKFKVSGLLGTSNKMISSLYNPQASGIEYIAQVKDNFLGKQSYAQVSSRAGSSLQPLLPMWKALRNVVYALSSIVFIFIGIMIMLRVKISPQAVITIQNSIPKLVTSLILVTFSYAIAGLVIDLSYWIQGLVIALIFTAKGVGFNSSLYNQFAWQTLIPTDAIVDTSVFYNFNGLMNADFIKLSMLANRTVPFGSLILLGGIVGQVVLGSIIGGLGGLFGSGSSLAFNIVGGGVGWVVGVIGGVVFMLILFILVAFWLIKLFFGLLKTYVAILLKIITGPLEIGMGAFPNSKMGFSSWIIDLISKVAVFPVVLIALVFTNYLIEISTCDLWIPNLLNAGGIGGGLGVCNGNGYIGAAIGLACLAMMSKLPDLVPSAIFQLKPSAFGQAIGEGFASTKTITKPIQKYGVEAGVDQATKVSTDQNGNRITTGWRGVVGRVGKTADKLNRH